MPTRREARTSVLPEGMLYLFIAKGYLSDRGTRKKRVAV